MPPSNVDRPPMDALALVSQAAELDDPRANYWIALMRGYIHRFPDIEHYDHNVWTLGGLPSGFFLAPDHLARAAELGDPMASYRLGMAYIHREFKKIEESEGHYDSDILFEDYGLPDYLVPDRERSEIMLQKAKSFGLVDFMNDVEWDVVKDKDKNNNK